MRIIQEPHAFRLEQRNLPVCAAEGEGGGNLAVLFHDPMAGNDAWLGIYMKRVADDPGQTGVSDRGGHLAVGGAITAITSPASPQKKN